MSILLFVLFWGGVDSQQVGSVDRGLRPRARQKITRLKRS